MESEGRSQPEIKVCFVEHGLGWALFERLEGRKDLIRFNSLIFILVENFKNILDSLRDMIRSRFFKVDFIV
jgi:hypothetical protein